MPAENHLERLSAWAAVRRDANHYTQLCKTGNIVELPQPNPLLEQSVCVCVSIVGKVCVWLTGAGVHVT